MIAFYNMFISCGERSTLKDVAGECRGVSDFPSFFFPRAKKPGPKLRAIKRETAGLEAN